MPTIDELAPATAATDSDELPVSQNNITRKITRAQILAGVQTQLTIPAGSLVGRTTPGPGSPQAIAVGNYLSLVSGTLSAQAAPYSIALSPAGQVPSAGDLVPLGQGGTNTSVTYSVFLQGLSAIANINGTQILVTPAGGTSSLRLADLAASVITRSGGSLLGPLSLSSDPSAPLQAATKQYADTKINRVGDTLTGPLQLAGDPVLALHAASKGYVDNNSSFPRLGFTMAGPIVLSGDPITALNPATKSFAELRILRSGDTMTGPLALSTVPTSNLHAATKSYVDAQIATSLPLAGGILTGPLTLSSDPISAFQAVTRQYADTKLAKIGDTLSGYLTLATDPSGPLHAATKNYVDLQVLTGLPKAGGTMSGPILLSGNPTVPSHAATKNYVDTGLAAVLPIAGGSMTGPISLTAAPAAAAHATNKQYVDNQIASALPLSGGSLSGTLTLASAPTSPLHAATKQYVDANPGSDGVINVRLSPCNAKLDGKTDDTAAFVTAYQLVQAGGTIYVPNGTTIIQTAANWGIPITKRVKWIIDGTTLADGSPLGDSIPAGTSPGAVLLPATATGFGATGSVISQSASQPTDFAVAHSSYVVNHVGGSTQSVISNSRTDTIINQSPFNHVWSGLDRLVWSGSQTPSASSPSRHVGRFTQSIRQTVGTDATNRPLPQPLMWATYAQFIDATGRPSSWTNASVVAEVDWIGNGADDGNQRQIQSLVVGQYDTTGAPVEISAAVGVSLAGGSSGKIYRVFNINVPYSVSVLDTSNATQLPGAAAIRLAAGQTVAFEATNSVNMSYSSSSGAIVARYGTTACAVGRGISVGFSIVFSASGAVPAASSGCIVFLVGSGSYTIALPAAGAVTAGSGFTFSAVGSGIVSIVPASGDSIDLAPITLRQFDRYHIISDGSSLWREVFRSNSVAPRFSGPPVLPSYLLAGLPAPSAPGAKAFTTNGRKPNEAAGAGTGVEVFYDGVQWVSVCSGLPVTA